MLHRHTRIHHIFNCNMLISTLRPVFESYTHRCGHIDEQLGNHLSLMSIGGIPAIFAMLTDRHPTPELRRRHPIDLLYAFALGVFGENDHSYDPDIGSKVAPSIRLICSRSCLIPWFGEGKATTPS